MIDDVCAALPEIPRRAAAECARARLVVSGATVTVLSFCLYLLSTFADERTFNLFTILWVLDAVVLVGLGSARVMASVSDEKRLGTWELQLLTPLSSRELALGKLLGAPLFAVWLFVLLLPWNAMAVARSDVVSAARGLESLVLLIAATFLAWSVSLLVSAYTSSKQGVSDGVKIFMLAPLIPFAASAISLVISPDDRARAIRYLGVDTPPWLFLTVSSVIFGAWALESARARIAVDKLEPLLPWRLPAFILFIELYQCGFGPLGLAVGVIVPCAILVAAAVGEQWGPSEWRRWLERPKRFWSQAPCWIYGLAACAASALVVFALRAYSPIDGSTAAYSLLVLVFVARDLFFLQWMRLRVRRNPELLAFVYIGIAYALPALIIGVLHVPDAAWLALPFLSKGRGVLVNILPGAAQAILVGAALSREVRLLSRAPR